MDQLVSLELTWPVSREATLVAGPFIIVLHPSVNNLLSRGWWMNWAGWKIEVSLICMYSRLSTAALN